MFFYNIILFLEKIILYFIFFYFQERLTLALLAKMIKPKYLPIMALFTIVISISFFMNFIKHKKNNKGFFGSYVWWNNYRLIHSFMFALFSIQALVIYKNAWIVLFIDALLGLIFFIFKYYFQYYF